MTAHPLGVEIACDGPDANTDCPDSAAIRAAFTSLTARQVRADGRAEGWTTQRSAGRLRDVCPTCRALTTRPERTRP